MKLFWIAISCVNAFNISRSIPCHGKNTTMRVTSELNRILSPENYDIWLRPYFGKRKSRFNALYYVQYLFIEGQPVVVKIGIHVQEIFAISEVNMDYQMTVYFRQTWKGNSNIGHTFS